MRKPTAISLVIVGIIISALVFVLVTKKADAPAAHNSTEDSAEIQTTDKREKDNLAQTSRSGQYVPYDEAKLAASENDNYLFFHAPWCPQCRAIEDSINAGGEIPEDVTIYKVDFDSNQTLRKQYGVTLQTTFVKVNSQGNLIDKYVAYENPSIEAVVENFINK